MVQDKQGNKYYDVLEGMQVLGVGRSTFHKRVAGLPEFRQEHDSRKVFYRVEDIEALKTTPVVMKQVERTNHNGHQTGPGE